MRYRVQPTAEQEERAREWLKQPMLSSDKEAEAQLERDLEEIIGRPLSPLVGEVA